MSIEPIGLAIDGRGEQELDARPAGAAPRSRSAVRAAGARADAEPKSPEPVSPRAASRGRLARSGFALRTRLGPAGSAPTGGDRDGGATDAEAGGAGGGAAGDAGARGGGDVGARGGAGGVERGGGGDVGARGGAGGVEERRAGSEVWGRLATAERDREEAHALLGYLAGRRDFDFASYQPASLLRRIGCRMAATGVDGYGAYRAHLERDPEEYVQLLEAVPVQRTEFFRNDEAWAHLIAEVLPRVLRGKGPGEAVRVWSAGCATGQEAYTLAIALAEAAGAGGAGGRAVVFATDVSDGAVAKARAGRYRAERMRQVRPAVLARYFARDGDEFVVRPEVHRLVVFGRHDLLRDPPLQRMDFVACRNTLMYFTPAAQARVLANFYRALTRDGLLFTGQVETPHAWSDLFAAESPEHHLYCKAESRGPGAARAPRAGALVDDGRPAREAQSRATCGRGSAND